MLILDLFPLNTMGSFADKIGLLLNDALEHRPTPSQVRVIRALGSFLASGKPHCTLLINGYAGTGKTTLVQSLVRVLPQLKMQSVLMAPTGRAAKVLAGYTGVRAYTIHRKIYALQSGELGKFQLELAMNRHRNTLFVVDEASMIGRASGGSGFGSRDLLRDLLEYVFSRDDCKLLLIGDSAQLPPVHHNESPALDKGYLAQFKNLTIALCQMSDVVRQASDSGILELATQIREHINSGGEGLMKLATGRDVISISGNEFPELLEEAYDNYGSENTLVITRSNKRANLFNQQIRHRLLWREERINAGDMLMVVRNNYHWLDAKSKAGFIANGDTAEVLQVLRFEDKFGFSFAKALLRLTDYPDEPELEAMLILDTLESDSPALDSEEGQRLREEVMETYAHLNTKTALREAMRNDPYLNAIQVKFAYAVTCHKSQGGQWNSVFLDQGYVTEEMLDKNYYRWLYTGVTRATDRLYLVNFSPSFLED